MTIKEFQNSSKENGYDAKLVIPSYFKRAGFTGKALSIEKDSKYVALMPLKRISSDPATPKVQFTHDPEPSKDEENLIDKFADENIK